MFKPEYVERQYSATVLWSLGGIHTAVAFVDAVRTVGKTVASFNDVNTTCAVTLKLIDLASCKM